MQKNELFMSVDFSNDCCIVMLRITERTSCATQETNNRSSERLVHKIKLTAVVIIDERKVSAT
jgi:hypothetical protein